MPIILNKKELLESNPEFRGKALDILEAGLEAIDTQKVLREKVSVKDGILHIKDGEKEISASLPSPGQGEGGRRPGGVYFIGIGKCALNGARVIEEILGGYLTAGAVIDVKDEAEAEGLKKIKYFKGTHPLPSEQNILATKEILKMIEGVTENDLVVTLISGGGSSLFELPAEGVSLQDIIDKTKELTARGADIYEMNKMRENMSQVKGGKFAEMCRPAKIVSLIFSDVIGNDISVIASGPTVLNEPNERVNNILLASNHDALIAMKSKAEELGFDAEIKTETLFGNASEVGKELAQREPKSGTCLLFGGETTVKLPAFAHENELHRGEGGRNQELALSALPFISQNALLISCASDGWDNSEHAGALADKKLFEKSKLLGLDAEEFLKKSDSYNFFEKAGGAIYTSRLGSNVSDLVIILYK